ncbi:MAG: RNA pyrophosphohydrolase [Pseudomonadales bacterium]
MIDTDGFRPNVGIMLADSKGRLLWAKRVRQNAWQFPQGGIDGNESPRDAMYRELYEEVGLQAEHVEVMAWTRGWLRYRLPQHLIRKNNSPVCIGQKQKWFLLRMLGDDEQVSFQCGSSPEFDHWRWVSYWYPLGQVVPFKRDVYRRALTELAPRHSQLVKDES